MPPMNKETKLNMERCAEFMALIIQKYGKDVMEEKVDVGNLEAERENLREQLRQIEGAKKKLTEQMDKLDVTDLHYNRKYQDMQDNDPVDHRVAVVEFLQANPVQYLATVGRDGRSGELSALQKLL